MLLNSKDYNETVDYLYGLQKHGIKLGLKNTERLMSILGEPRNSFRAVHIAGTNGKGSTAAIIASILKESGFKVGMFTSPHLVSFTERIKINNSPISEEDVAELTSYIRKIIAATDLKPTFFEFITAMAFYYFACEKVDWAVVEVGMGGRFDATNVILPIVSVITNIGFDHKEFLGQSISEIAFEKAGIIKHAIPVVTAVNNSEALEVIENVAKKTGSEIYIYGKDFKGSLTFIGDRHITFDYSSINHSIGYINNFKDYKNLTLPLSGRHQLYNASLAIRTCETLRHRGFTVTDGAINDGISRLKFGGRLEWISQTPSIIIDSAHNPDAAKALADAVKEIFLEHKKIILIIGIMKDKDIEGVLSPLTQIADTIILTKPEGERAASPERLKEALKKLEKWDNRNSMLNSIITTNTVDEAIERAKELWNENYIILITGSFYTTGEAKELLGHPGVLSYLRE